MWFLLFAGPVAWTVHLVFVYALVEITCSPANPSRSLLGLDVEATMHAATAVLSVVIAVAGWLAYKRLKWARTEGDATNAWLSVGAISSSVIFLIVTLIEGVGPFLLPLCEASL
jgi:hypothetical protein